MLEGEEGQEKEVGRGGGGAGWVEPRWSVCRASAMVETGSDLQTGS